MKVIDYLKDTRGELKHVSWPTQRQTIAFTLLVIAISIFFAFFLGLFDFIFTTLLDILISSDSGGSSLQVTQEAILTGDQVGSMELSTIDEAADTPPPLSDSI